MMAFLDRFRTQPEWKHADAAVRAAAVRKLKAEEQDLLASIAREDADAGVRKAALRRLSDQASLIAIARDDADAGVREEAGAVLAEAAQKAAEAASGLAALAAVQDQKQLAKIAAEAALPEVRQAALSRVTSARSLASVVRGAADSATRLAALARIEDAGALADIAAKSEHKDAALAALERVSDAQALKTIAARSKHKVVARKAKAVLDAQAPQAPAADPGKQRLELVERLEGLGSSSDWVQVAEELSDARYAWRDVSGSADAGLQARFDAAADKLDARLAENAEARAAQERAAAEKSKASAERQQLCERVEALRGEAVEEGLTELEAAWAALAPREDMDDLAKRFRSACEAARQKKAATASEEERRARVPVLLQEIEALPAAEGGEARGRARKLQKEWAQLEASGLVDEAGAARAKEIFAGFEARDAASRQEREKQQKDNLARLTALADRVEKLKDVEEPSLRDLDHALRDIRTALDQAGPLPTKQDRDNLTTRLKDARQALYPKLQERRSAEEWKRWANLQVQEELAQKAEALLQVTDLAEAANQLRELEEAWKTARQVPKEQGEALWQRFKKARDEVRTKTAAHFKELKAQRDENLKKKLALCEEVEALAGSTEWIKTAERIKQLQAEWQKTGPAPKAQSEQVWQRFRKACDTFFERRKTDLDQRKNEWQSNLEKKEALCARAEALQDSTDWTAAAGEIRKLQQEWKAIGPVKKSRSEAIWQRFRKACDHFFERYKHRSTADHESAVAAREAILGELESYLPAGEAQAPHEEPPGLGVKVQVAQTGWSQAAPLPRERVAPLQKRFDEVVRKLAAAYPATFQGTDFDPEAVRRKGEKLCQKVEELAAQVEPVRPKDPESLVAQLREALATNTMRGHGESKWKELQPQVEAAQDQWKRLGPGVDASLQERFHKACNRFWAQRPR